MKQLTILSGAGINLAIGACCEEATDLANFSYQRISAAVYGRLPEHLQRLFDPDSFDYILGGLLTVNLALEKMHAEIGRFRMRPEAFDELFGRTELQTATQNALAQIEQRLRIGLAQLLHTSQFFSDTVDRLFDRFEAINYFTVNFDAIMDHILYGPGYVRGGRIGDFWRPNGKLDREQAQQCQIFHLHGDLRYKPHKVTSQAAAEYQWPVLVVGDGEVKKGIIASHEALRFFNRKLKHSFDPNRQLDYDTNVLALIGFGFREEDEHIATHIRSGITKECFTNVYAYGPSNPLENLEQVTWVDSAGTSLRRFLNMLGSEQ